MDVINVKMNHHLI